MKEKEFHQLPDLKINGSGTVGGGLFRRVEINGSGEVRGDTECEEVKINGSGRIEGTVKARFVKTNGSSVLGGELEVAELETNGSTVLRGHVQAQTIKTHGAMEAKQDVTGDYVHIYGSGKVGGRLRGKDIQVQGMMTVSGDCEADRFRAKGMLTIHGLLNADEVDIHVKNRSSVQEVGGGKITVKKMGGLFSLLERFVKTVFQQDDCFSADIIEGDEIYLEATKAKLVRGRKVMIGEQCEIGVVEYTDSFEIVGNGTVTQSIKL
ncbi:polymer-forming cytoskeletal protein [Aneurinibacillus migulanus]|uniref:polymer-forming cytoskeletal protein n=1 Tax=Aneurinibacillus migulanus TaxID=47500 RepID=UPI002E25090E|nr:polymer-forming cytoskeletal protein [Aneurinibacillus migulanus]